MTSDLTFLLIWTGTRSKVENWRVRRSSGVDGGRRYSLMVRRKSFSIHSDQFMATVSNVNIHWISGTDCSRRTQETSGGGRGMKMRTRPGTVLVESRDGLRLALRYTRRYRWARRLSGVGRNRFRHVGSGAIYSVIRCQPIVLWPPDSVAG